MCELCIPCVSVRQPLALSGVLKALKGWSRSSADVGVVTSSCLRSFSLLLLPFES